MTQSTPPAAAGLTYRDAGVDIDAGNEVVERIKPLVKRTLRIDDSLDVFAVHGVGGIIGSILLGIFMSDSLGGVGFAEGKTMLTMTGVQQGKQ